MVGFEGVPRSVGGPNVSEVSCAEAEPRAPLVGRSDRSVAKGAEVGQRHQLDRIVARRLARDALTEFARLMSHCNGLYLSVDSSPSRHSASSSVIAQANESLRTCALSSVGGSTA